MSALTTVATLQYKAWRYPAQLVETRLVSTYLPRTSSARLAFERVLGTLDSTAGSLLGDETLQQRGDVLLQRVEKQSIQREHEAEADRLKAERDAEAAAVARKAEQRQRGDGSRPREASEVILAAERDRLDAREARVEARVVTRKGAKKR
jgi:hypothetical protein